MDITTLRRMAVLRAFPNLRPLEQAIATAGFVQADPIRAPARAQDLILRHRVTGYRAGDLERHYPRLALEEGYLYAYGFMPARVRSLLLPRHDPETGDGRFVPTGLAADVLACVREHGPTHPAALEAHFGAERQINGWGGVSKATTRVLEKLLRHGLMRVARREAGVRIYQATPEPEPELAPQECLEQLVLLVASVLAPVALPTLGAATARLTRTVMGPQAKYDTVAALIRADALESAVVDGVRYLWPAVTSGDDRNRRSVRFLAPFDPLVWDRRRFEHLWGWPYRFEAYTPPPKRRLGYYAMPLLWGSDVVGWVNCTRAGRGLDVKAGFAGRKPGADFRRAFEAEVERMRRFLDAAYGA
ncbi:MAG: YcaQ family DNA glycosylase [Acetobacteraceae bacterium]|nr:YcaQ family DNA glycosylase [Acetobacteraceae bacterium]